MQRYLILALLLQYFVIGCKESKEHQPTIQDIEEWVFAPGQLEWDEQYNLSAQAEGILLNANFDIGSPIKVGEVIANIDNKSSIVNTKSAKEQLKITTENLTLKSPALNQLKQNIQIAEKKYAFDKSQEERYAALFKNDNVTKVEFENIKLSAENSLSNLNALKNQYALLLQQALQQNINAKSQYNNSKIIESFNNINAISSGVVVKKMKSTGDYVRKGEVIALIANANKIEVVLNIDESNIGRVKVGQKAKVKLNIIKDKIFDGRIKEVQTTFDDRTQSFVCKVELNEQIEPEWNIFGTPLECNILVGEKKNALLIPREYLGFNNTVRLKGKKEVVKIKTGIISTDFVEVVEGLEKDAILLPIKP